MANKDLINLGYSPDSGTGDSARRGGEKINNLFSDVYSQFGDNPVGQDPSQPFYGYRRPFFEYEYKVGELHPAGRFIPIEFKTTDSRNRIYDSEHGYGYDNTGTLIDTDGDGIPDIYRDSEWYFLSRGEQIDADFTAIDSDNNVNFVLPIGVPGDQIIIRDGFGTWNNTINDKGIHVNFWTTPFEFQSIDQVLEWEKNTNILGTDIDSETLAVFDPISGNAFRSNWHKVKSPAAIGAVYPKLDQPFATSRSTNPYDGLAPTYVVNSRRYQYEFLFSNYKEGWIMRQIALDAADVGATLLQFGQRLDAVDSDLDRGLYVSADSDIRHTVPIFRRTPDGREIHGTLAFRGDSAIATTIDSEDTVLINDPSSAGGGDAVQPLTTTVRFSLRENISIKNNLFVGNDVEIGHHLQVGETLTVDSDLAYFNNNVQIHEKLTVDSDVHILGQLVVDESSTFKSDVRFEKNIWIGGDSTNVQTESLRVRDNLITLSTNSNNAPLMDTGFIFQRYDRISPDSDSDFVATDVIYNPFMVWNETNDKFTFGETVSSDSEQVLTKARVYAEIARGNFAINDSDNDARLIFQKVNHYPDAVRGIGDLKNPNERVTVEPDYELNVKANAVFGRDSDDVVVFNSRIMSNLVPFGDEIYNLGDSDNKWKDLYLSGNTIYLGSVQIKDVGGKVLFIDSDNHRIDLSGSKFTAESVTVDSDLSIGGNSLLLGELHVQEHAKFDSDVFIAGNFVVGDDVELGGRVRMLESLTVDSDAFLSGDLHVDSDVIIKGQLSVGMQTKIDDTLYVKDNAYFDSDVFIRGNLTVGDHIVLGGQVLIQEGLIVDSDVVFGNDLRVDSDVIIKGQLSVGMQTKIDDTLYVKGNAYFDSDVLVRGSFTVNGTTTYVNTNNLEVSDNLIVLNKNQATPFNDTGIVFQRYDSDSVSPTNWNVSFMWDESTDSFVMGRTSSSGILPNPTDNGRYVDFFNTGDVKFYEETGVTARFHWDASTERVGIGLENPENPLHIRMDGSKTTAPSATTYNDFIQLDQYISDVTTAASGPSIRFSLKDTNNQEAIARIKAMARNDATWGDNDEGNMSLVFETTDGGVSADKMFVTGQGNVAFGSLPTAAGSPFFFDMTGASDPEGLNRPTLTGDGTGVIDGGTF